MRENAIGCVFENKNRIFRDHFKMEIINYITVFKEFISENNKLLKFFDSQVLQYFKIEKKILIFNCVIMTV